MDNKVRVSQITKFMQKEENIGKVVKLGYTTSQGEKKDYKGVVMGTTAFYNGGLAKGYFLAVMENGKPKVENFTNIFRFWDEFDYFGRSKLDSKDSELLKKLIDETQKRIGKLSKLLTGNKEIDDIIIQVYGLNIGGKVEYKVRHNLTEYILKVGEDKYVLGGDSIVNGKEVTFNNIEMTIKTVVHLINNVPNKQDIFYISALDYSHELTKLFYKKIQGKNKVRTRKSTKQ